MKFGFRKSKLAAALAVVVSLSACTTALVEPIRKDINTNDARARQIMLEAKRGLGDVGESRAATAVYHNDKMWIPTKTVSDMEKSRSHEMLSKQISVNKTFYNVKQFAEYITNKTGVPVNVSPDALIDPLQNSMNGGVSGGMGQMPQGPLPMVPGLGGQTGAQGMYGNSYSMPVSLAYEGSVASLLDTGAASFGLSWEKENNAYNIFRYKTKTFRLVALPGDLNMTNNITNSTASSGSTGGSGDTGASVTASSGGSNSTTGVSISNMSVYSATLDAVKSMLSEEGKVTASQATGTLTVRDTPQIIEQVGVFIEDQNDSLGKQVDVNVRVLSVDLNDDDQYGINWNAMYQSLSQNFGLNLTNTFATNANASNLSLQVLGTAGGGGNSNIDSWRGSQAIISALSTQGNVSQITSASLTTLNNQPAPLQVARQTSYIASSTTNTTQGAGSTVTQTPGLVTTGFTMSLVPHLQNKGKLLLQFAIDISTLVRLDTSSAGIQTPIIDTRNFLQRVKMNAGDTLVLAGFEQANLNMNLQGVGSPENVAFGGGVTGGRGRSIVVIIIQPLISGI